nr:immunoglobulin heavy chain junction region [Macaca mulatta]MOV54232.1 immunoglobulin heavy chain junction region [Macaca mulatta]MOV55531.1 immunoglobulin heavy chain junction region [Macaca mulatta]MOV55756.1 immunoglobulin heavy chain junction region [Macaca mulatta]MOV56372.1 immunoglobulin heavy chain junction region [Macaca mulatta]
CARSGDIATYYYFDYW